MVNDQNEEDWNSLSDKKKLNVLRESCQQLYQRLQRQEVLIQELFSRLEKAVPKGDPI